MASKAMFFVIFIAATNCFNIETFMDIYCQEPIKILDLYSYSPRKNGNFYKKSLEHRCGIWIKNIPNKTWTSDISNLFRTRSRSKLSVLKISEGLKILDENFLNFKSTLKHLDLSGNDLDFIPKKVKIFYRINILDLSKNSFTNLPFVENKIYKLEELDLSENKLNEVHLNFLLHFTKLEKLLLRKNNITKIQPPSGYTNIKHLDLSENHLRDLQGCESLDKLKVLMVSYNDLQFLHSSVGIWSLEDLHLDHNKIEEISEDAFVHFPNLKVLKLNGNRLTNLKQGIFTILNRLESLDISNNFVTSLNAALFVSQKKLVTLNFKNNLVESFNYTYIVEFSPSLTEIDLLGNNFDCGFLKNMLSFFDDKIINIPGGEVCIPPQIDAICCNTKTRAIPEASNLTSSLNTKMAVQKFDPEFFIMNRTSTFFSSMETKIEALLKLFFYQFAFIVSVTLLVFVVFVYHSFGRVIVDSDKQPPELHKMIQSI